MQFWDLLYPNHWTPEGRQIGAERMRLIKNSDRFTTFVKAVDDQTGEILGMAKWQIYDNALPSEDDKVEGSVGDYWSDPEDKAYFLAMVPLFVSERNAEMQRTKGNLVCLDILTVDPAHQRKMVGDALVKWGTSIADKMGVEATVESSVYGKGLYQKNGFVFIKNHIFNVPGSNRPDCACAWLIRPKKAT